MVRDSLLQAGSKTNNLNCDVKVGDRIFFRLQSRYDGEDDRVLWNPIITYISLPVGKDRYLSEDLKTYNSKADYIEGENNVAIFNRTGKVTLHAPYMKGKTSDDVTLIVTRLDQHGETIVKRLKLPADSVVNGSYDYTDDINEKDSISFFFEITTTSPVDWTKVQWAGSYNYEDDQESVRFVASRRMFNKPVSIAGSKVLKQGVTVLNRQYRPKLFIVPTLSVVREDKKNDTDTATVYLTLHDQNGLPVLHHTCRLNTSNTLKVDTIIVTDTTLIKRLNTGKVTATFAVSNELSKSTHAKVSLLRDSLSYQSATSTVVTAEQRVLVDTLEACVFSGYNSVDYGRLYRGWGQFAYNGNKAYATQPIEVSALTIDRDKYKDIAEHYKSTHDGNQLAKSLTPVNEQRFFVMGYDANKRMYVGGSEHVFISLDTICSSRIGEDAIIIDSVYYAKNAGDCLPLCS